MKRAKKPTAAPVVPPPASRGARARPVVTAALTLGFAALVLFGLSAVGDEARRNIGPRNRYLVRFANIECPAPPGGTRETFLAEVRYASGAAPTFQALDPNLTGQLTAAFAAHPWVASVDAVSVEPPNAVTVALTFRKPVLAVPQRDGPRVVDARGLLLPASAPADNLPTLLNAPALPDTARAGLPWPSNIVTGAAPVAAEYKPLTIERTAQGWELVLPSKQKLLVAK